MNPGDQNGQNSRNGQSDKRPKAIQTFEFAD